tara:strand:- start:575 stop:763 length:189 start_codon:yes stop_codon:yes gene_type:complete
MVILLVGRSNFYRFSIQNNFESLFICSANKDRYAKAEELAREVWSQKTHNFINNIQFKVMAN